MTAASPLSVLCLGTSAPVLNTEPWGPFDVRCCASLDVLTAAFEQAPADAVLLQSARVEEAAAWPVWGGLSQACHTAAVVALVPHADATLSAALMERGVHDVLPLAEATSLARTIHLAVLRRRADQTTRAAYATDLATGLPNQMQLLEHISHLLALREREPAPMALLVIRMEGLATAEAQLGNAAAGALRRKLAVRLRASLRSSDVVASVASDAFAALLAWIDTPQAAERVGAKAQKALQRPLRVADRDVAVAVSIGIAHCPEKGGDAHSLLRDAFQQAAVQSAAGRAGFGHRAERGAGPAAANDDEA